MVRRILAHPRITTHLGAKVAGVDGFVGNFKSRLASNGESKEVYMLAYITGDSYYDSYGSAIDTVSLDLNPPGALGGNRVGIILAFDQDKPPIAAVFLLV